MSKLQLANIEDLKEIMLCFRKYKDIFPHIRQDKIKDKILKSNAVYDEGVFIAFTKYKKKTRLGDITTMRGDYILHQIFNITKGNGKSNKILNKFFKYIQPTNNLWLTVRASNIIANNFYKKMGFTKVSDIYWKNKTIKGNVYNKKLMNLTGGLFN